MYTWPKATEKSRSCVGSHVGGVGNRGVWERSGGGRAARYHQQMPTSRGHNHAPSGPGAGLRTGVRCWGRWKGEGGRLLRKRWLCVLGPMAGKLSYTKLGSEKQGREIGLMQGRDNGDLEQRDWALPLPALHSPARTSNSFSWTTKRTDITTQKKYIKKSIGKNSKFPTKKTQQEKKKMLPQSREGKNYNPKQYHHFF